MRTTSRRRTSARIVRVPVGWRRFQLTVACAGVAAAAGAGAGMGVRGSAWAAVMPDPPQASPPPSASRTSSCASDDPVPTPRGWVGWDRSAVFVWEAIEQAGGVVPEIEEDVRQAPPAWWRYPSAMRSEALLDAEARNPTRGLYRAVAPPDIAKGDILVRTRGAGVCGKMALLANLADGKWVVIETDAEGRDPAARPGSPLYFAADGHTLLPLARAFRIRVKKDETIGHVRELERDLEHLERTIARRPPLLAPGEGAREAVTEKVHELLDEAWSLVAEESFDLTRRELAGRALVLGAYLGWPGAAAAASAVLDDVLKKSPERPGTLATRASLAQLIAAEPPDAVGAVDPSIRYLATADDAGVESRSLGFRIRWPLTWRLEGIEANPDMGVIANLATGRALAEDGHADRAAAVLLAQRLANTGARAALARAGARKMFPDAKMKALAPLVTGSRRAEFRETHDGTARAGEVTTITRGDVVTFLVLNAPADVYPKFREEYAAFVRSLSSIPIGAATVPTAGAVPDAEGGAGAGVGVGTTAPTGAGGAPNRAGAHRP